MIALGVLYYIAGLAVSYVEMRYFYLRLDVTYPTGKASQPSLEAWVVLVFLSAFIWPVVVVTEHFIDAPIGWRTKP